MFELDTFIFKLNDFIISLLNISLSHCSGVGYDDFDYVYTFSYHFVIVKL